MDNNAHCFRDHGNIPSAPRTSAFAVFTSSSRGGGCPYKKLRAGWHSVPCPHTVSNLRVPFTSSYNPFSISANEFLPNFTVCVRLHCILFHQTLGARCWWRSWLRHCATSRKAAGSILEDVAGIFHGHNPSDRTMALVLTEPLIEMSTRSISWG